MTKLNPYSVVQKRAALKNAMGLTKKIGKGKPKAAKKAAAKPAAKATKPAKK